MSSPTNATITDGQGAGTILDDEPRIGIGTVTKAEGMKGQTTQFTVTVTLSAAYDQAVPDRQRHGHDRRQRLHRPERHAHLRPGETSKTITITVTGDSKKESNEYFFLDLFGNSSNSLFTKSRGTGTILNDD